MSTSFLGILSFCADFSSFFISLFSLNILCTSLLGMISFLRIFLSLRPWDILFLLSIMNHPVLTFFLSIFILFFFNACVFHISLLECRHLQPTYIPLYSFIYFTPKFFSLFLRCKKLFASITSSIEVDPFCVIFKNDVIEKNFHFIEILYIIIILYIVHIMTKLINIHKFVLYICIIILVYKLYIHLYLA